MGEQGSEGMELLTGKLGQYKKELADIGVQLGIAKQESNNFLAGLATQTSVQGIVSVGAGISQISSALMSVHNIMNIVKIKY